MLVMGFPPRHWFPPKRNPKPRCTPPLPGLLLCERAEHMPSNRCKQCDQPLVEIDHWGERLTGCTAGKPLLANGADSRLMTSWRYGR
jgi:hypothetical protein